MFPGAGFDCNVYLVTGNKPLLVDTGTGAYAHRLEEKVKKLVGENDLAGIVLTHRHFDHIGGAAELSRIFSATVYAHELDAAPIIEGSAKDTEATMFMRTPQPVLVKPLKGGEVLSTGEHNLTVIHTPGHSIGGICLFDRLNKILLSGDTVFAGGVGRWDLATGDHKLLVSSVKHLMELDIQDLYPGHGPCALGDGAEQIRDAFRYLGEY
jgi:glyoxylase-like metal-dependent hydrolase (beta-lactamase superfamily II)